MVTNNAINVATASSGTVLQGQGVGTAPAFSTATYPATTTINQILYSSAANTVGGLATANNGVLTTGTSGVPVITALSSNGQLIIGSGSGAPAAATLTAGTGITITNGANSITIADNSASANANLLVVDDFVGYNIPSAGQIVSSFSWTTPVTSPTWASTNATTGSGHPGVLSFAGIVANGTTFLSLADNAGNIILGGGTVTLNWIFNIKTLSNGTNRYTMSIGLGDTNNSVDQTNGCYVEYSDNLNSGDWEFITASASTRTTSTSSTAVTTGWHNLQITVNAAASSVSFLMDGVSLGTAITTNIPTTAISPLFFISVTAGTMSAGTITHDLVYLSYALTNAR